MRHARRLPAASVLLAAVTLMAGCGGDPEASNAYVDDVTAAQRAYVNKFTQVSKRLKPTSTLAEDRAALSAFAEANRGFVEELEGITPPESVTEEHAKLVGVVESYGRDVEEAAGLLRSGSAEERAKARTELSSNVEGASREIADAVQAINEGLGD